MYHGFSKHLPASLIANQVKALGGQVVSVRTIARRKSEWEAEQRRRKERREYAEDLIAAARTGNFTASEAVNAFANEAIMRDPEGFMSLNPIDVQRTSIQAEKLRLQKEKLELSKRQMTLDEQKFELLKAREQRAIAVLDDHRESVTPEQRIQGIREIYGLRD
jgi:hypothetical protein